MTLYLRIEGDDVEGEIDEETAEQLRAAADTVMCGLTRLGIDVDGVIPVFREDLDPRLSETVEEGDR